LWTVISLQMYQLLICPCLWAVILDLFLREREKLLPLN
jgi:hypothetical protein